ncbi:MAG: D-inositol 3-phosphate glycosyltransferase [Candidatus Omnitrophica bacterium ADurb.Bin292]|nr:MAG: D-inositol 3-phosphate glycosyltransferase [Candidatus Omnitrophica bacterium ADurb.Bin292]
MKIALLCPGLGNIDRGHEVFARSIFALLKDDVEMTLFKGGGEQTAGEIVVDNIPRYSSLLDGMRLCVSEKWKGAIREQRREDVECATFVHSALKPLLIGEYDIIHCLDKSITNIIWDFRYLFKKTPRILFSNGGAIPRKNLPQCDFVHEYTEHNLKRGIKERSFLIPHGVDLKLFDPGIKTDFRSKYDIPQDALMILSVGKICYWHKRTDYLINEVSKIKGAYLVIAGQESPDSPAIKDLGRKLLGDRAVFLQLSHSDLAQLYKAADIFALASLNETFGIVYIEAMAMGLPVIASAHPNIRQILKNQIFINMAKKGNLEKTVV